LLRICLFILLLVHGVIHVVGLFHAYQWLSIAALSKPMARSIGLLWGFAGLLLLASAALMLWRNERWWMVTGVAIVVSQGLIVSTWHDARFGTIANALLLVAVISGGASW
jgi:hypothetical protein